MTEIVRLHLANLRGVDGLDWPVHGFVILDPRAGAILVDSGVGGPEDVLTDWRVVNRSVDEALGEHGLSPADIRIVINTHLHFDHCGQNAVFRHAPFYIQRLELDRARVESPELTDWFDFAGARYELLDGDAPISETVRVIATPGHTVGHQCVAVATGDGEELLIGDAAYTSRLYRDPDREDLPWGQADDHPAWSASLRRVHSMSPAAVHFCHDTHVVRRG